MKKDTLYKTIEADPLSKIRAFAFDEEVVPVFQDMISRSVPGYETMLRAIGVFAMKYAKPHTQLYDLGCSLGAVSFVLAEATKGQSCTVLGIDNSIAMVEAARDRLAIQKTDNISIIHDDIENVPITNASVIVSNFTLQFVQRDKRKTLIEKIFKGLNSGGVLILSEKIRAIHDDDDRFLIDHYHGYKKINGYSDEEISKKREALEDVLVPDSLIQWEGRLRDAGFTEVHQWFRCFNFISLIAIK